MFKHVTGTAKHSFLLFKYHIHTAHVLSSSGFGIRKKWKVFAPQIVVTNRHSPQHPAKPLRVVFAGDGLYSFCLARKQNHMNFVLPDTTFVLVNIIRHVRIYSL